MKNKRNYWGILFIVAAIIILASSLNILPDSLNVVSIVFTVLFAAWFIKSLTARSITGSIMSLALIATIYDKQLGITAISPGPLLISALLVSIGLNTIFGNHHSKKWKKNHGENIENISGDQINISCNYGGSVKYLNSNNFLHADIDANFSGLKVYFNNVNIVGPSASVDIKATFAGVELYIPKDWAIDNQVKTNLSGIDEEYRYTPPFNNASTDSDNIVNPATLTLTGSLSFSGLTIIHC